MKYLNCTEKSIEINIYHIPPALSNLNILPHFFRPVFPTYKMFPVCLILLYVPLLNLLSLFLLGPASKN